MQETKVIGQELAGTVRDAFTEDVYTVRTDAPVAEATNLMTELNLRRVIVIGRKNRVVGVISQRDILRHYLSTQNQAALGAEQSFGTEQVGNILTKKNAITVTPDVSLIKAAVVLATNKIGCLPVVGLEDEPLGVLSTTDMLRHITGRGKGMLESSFQMYTPASEIRAKMPAYIRQKTGDVVVPLKSLKKSDAATDFAILGFDRGTGRILIKFVPEFNAAEGVLRTKRDTENLVISATDFVVRFQLTGKATAFDVADHNGTRYLILTPRQNAEGRRTEPPKPPQRPASKDADD